MKSFDEFEKSIKINESEVVSSVEEATKKDLESRVIINNDDEHENEDKLK